jgi:hypothetical protein
MLKVRQAKILQQLQKNEFDEWSDLSSLLPAANIVSLLLVLRAVHAD